MKKVINGWQFDVIAPSLYRLCAIPSITVLFDGEKWAVNDNRHQKQFNSKEIAFKTVTDIINDAFKFKNPS